MCRHWYEFVTRLRRTFASLRKERGMARKLVVVAVSAVLAGLLVASLAGCGSGSADAGDLMAAADETMRANWKAVGQLGSRTDSLASWLSGALAAAGGIDQGGFDDEVEKARERVREIDRRYRTAGKEYERIIGMEDAAAYAAYAKLKILEIAQATALVDEIDSFLISVSVKIEMTGLELAWFASAMESYKRRFDELFEKVAGLAAEADAARAGKKQGN